MSSLSRRTAWTVAVIATLTMTVSYIDRQTLAAISPSVTADLDISETGFGVILAMFSVAYLIATPIAGWWIDRIGARRGLVRSVFAWSMVAMLQAIVPGFGTLLAVRIALGLAEGPGFPGAAQSIHRVLPPASRDRGVGLMFVGSSIGSVVAVPLALYLQRELDSWRAAFVATSLLGLAWVPAWLFVTRRAAVRARLDVVATDEVVVSRQGFVALATHPIMIRALIAIFACAPVLGFVVGWGPKYLVKAFKIDKLDAGHYLWLPGLVFDVGVLAFGDLAARGRKARGDGSPPRGLFVIAVLLCASLAVLPVAGTAWQATAVLAVAMAGGGAMYTLVTADMLGRMPAEAIAEAGGIIAVAQSLALIIANPLIGVAVDRYDSYAAATISLGGWVIPGALIWFAWQPALRFAPSR